MTDPADAVRFDLSSVAARLGDFDARTLELDGLRHAAVVVALVAGEDGAPVMLLTRRPARLRAHPGQFALPGGRIDDGETPEQAALRELHEELGLSAASGDIVGRLDDFATRSGYVMTPFVVAPPVGVGDIVASESEVAEVYAVTARELDAEPRMLDVPGNERPMIQWPFRGHLVHAPTAAVVYQFREVALHARPTRVLDLVQPRFAWK